MFFKNKVVPYLYNAPFCKCWAPFWLADPSTQKTMLSADSGDRLSTLSNSYYTASPVQGKRQALIYWWFKIECKGRWLFQKNVGKLSAEWNYNMVIIFSLEKVWEPAMLKSSLVVSVLVFRLSWMCWKCVGSTLDNDYWRELETR